MLEAAARVPVLVVLVVLPPGVDELVKLTGSAILAPVLIDSTSLAACVRCCVAAYSIPEEAGRRGEVCIWGQGM